MEKVICIIEKYRSDFLSKNVIITNNIMAILIHACICVFFIAGYFLLRVYLMALLAIPLIIPACIAYFYAGRILLRKTKSHTTNILSILSIGVNILLALLVIISIDTLADSPSISLLLSPTLILSYPILFFDTSDSQHILISLLYLGISSLPFLLLWAGMTSKGGKPCHHK
ncbi:MAG: hypothetical protein FWG87_07880 [Defluviitaleaceae bacterium]|nr:hypothetical protein [Defluviitaleaceae bacterium]